MIFTNKQNYVLLAESRLNASLFTLFAGASILTLLFFLYMAIGDSFFYIFSILTGAIGFFVGIFLCVHCSRVTFSATSVFAVACSFFVSLGIILSVSIEDLPEMEMAFVAFFCSVGSFAVLGSSILFSKYRGKVGGYRESANTHRSYVLSSGCSKQLMYISIVMFVLCFFVFLVFKPSWEPRFADDRSALLPIWNGFFVVSMLLVIYSLSFYVKSTITYFLLIGALMFVYSFVIFDGFGRLQFIALFLACATLAMVVLDKPCVMRNLIRLSLLLVAPLLWIAAYVGQVRGMGTVSSLSISDVFLRAEGLGSAFLLLPEFCKLLQQGDGLPTASVPLAWGTTYWASAVWFVPRMLWSDKPLGFGAELAYLLMPEYAIWGHTMLVTVFGEMFYNFGWAGLLIACVIVGWLLSKIDCLLIRIRRLSLGTPNHAFLSVAYALLVSGMVNFVWGGSGTFANREGTSLLALGLFVVGFRQLERRLNRTSLSTKPRRFK